MTDLSQWFSDHASNVAIILLIGGGLYYVGSYVFGRLVGQLVRGSHHRDWHHKDVEKRQKTVQALFVSVWRILVVFVIALSIFHELFPTIDLAPLFASAGILGVALGFGAQSLIKDLLSGIFIISENQYRVGDIIDIEGASGTVERIGTRSTVLRDADGNVHYFPNGTIAHVINKTMGFSMARFSLSLDPSTDIDKVTDIINRVGERLAKEPKWENKILEAPAFVAIGDVTGTSIDIWVAGKTQPSDQWGVVAEMRSRLLPEFETNDIHLAKTPPYSFASTKKK